MSRLPQLLLSCLVGSLLSALLFPGIASSAELRTSRGVVIVDGDNAFVEVDVFWRLSWRSERNWDAAWLTLKAPANWCGGTPVALAPRGHRTLTNRGDNEPDAAFAVPDDGRGMFVYRDRITSRPGTLDRGDNDWRLRLRLRLPDDQNASNLPDSLDVFGVEMVHIPEGAFSLGDPRPRSASPKHSFFEVTGDSTAGPPYRLESGGAIAVCDGPGSLCYRRATRSFEQGRDGDFSGPIPEAYPNGYNAFYLMKYEVTQGQYADFLNDVGRCGAPERTPMGHPGYDARGSLRFSNDEYGFVAERPDRAATDLSWSDAAAFADWMALRPMTELEFVKAARGTEAPVAGEFAWGSTVLVHGDTVYATDGSIAQDEATGNEYVLGNADFRPADARTNEMTGGDGSGGPLRVDIFETRVFETSPPSQDTFRDAREASGASYYGVQGLSGSLYERVVTATDADGRRFQGTHGDGRLLYPAAADVDDWPGPRGDGLGMRGGSTGRPSRYLQIADRTFGSYAAYYRLGGFRAARTAP